ncbi:MAG: ribonuclease HII [Alphaproteobacteria bacterium]|nr:ribonuclease HII [Alphaproteobacteria bacterium]
MRILGVDEAGRGCVLGPLVVGAFLLVDGDQATLRAAGADDSKRLSAKRRAAARAALAPLGTPDVRLIDARAIDAGNLNVLEEAAIVSLVLAHRPDHVVMDALGHPRTLPALEARLAAAIAPHGLAPTWHIAPKADRDHPVCGAASVFAKTTRDARLAELTAPHGDLGSGYPSDPKTRRWLAAHAATGAPWPAFVRTRWDTVAQLSQLSLEPGSSAPPSAR